jgi:hypothetical protein
MAIQATVPVNDGPDIVGAYVRLREHYARTVEPNTQERARGKGATTFAVAQIEIYSDSADTKSMHPSIHVDRVKVYPLIVDPADDNAVLTALYNKLKDHLVGLEHASSITSLSDIEDV